VREWPRPELEPGDDCLALFRPAAARAGPAGTHGLTPHAPPAAALGLTVVAGAAVTLGQDQLLDLVYGSYDGAMDSEGLPFSAGNVAGAALWSAALWFCSPLQVTRPWRSAWSSAPAGDDSRCCSRLLRCCCGRRPFFRPSSCHTANQCVAGAAAVSRLFRARAPLGLAAAAHGQGSGPQVWPGPASCCCSAVTCFLPPPCPIHALWLYQTPPHTPHPAPPHTTAAGWARWTMRRRGTCAPSRSCWW
jgi:hypothetical protein